MKVEFPEALLERVRAGNVVLCTGVRLAAAGGMPTWEDLLGKMASQLNGENKTLSALVKAGKLLTVAGYLKRKLGEETVNKAIEEAFGASTDPSATHKWLHQVPFHAALSTGYDCLLENALRDKDEPKVFSYEDGAALRLQEELKHYVVKVHGDVRTPQKAILSVSDFKHQIFPNEPYRAFLEDLFRTRTLLLVGYRSYDPDFVLLMDRLVSTFRDAAFDHYAILPDTTGPEMDELYANFRMRVIPYEAGVDPQRALGDVLKQFKEQFHKAGGTVEAVEDPVQWLQSQLSAVSVRIDVTAGQGLTLTRARLRRILETAGSVPLSALDAEALCRLGNVNLYLGEVQRGIECYNAALERDPDFARAHLNLHHAMAEVREFLPALQHLERAAELDESLRVVPKRYELKAVIGRGSLGTVYEARDTKRSKTVTVKLLRSAVVKEHVSPELWLEESSALIKLKHPNIVRTLDALIEGGRCVLVTEYLKGRSLERTLREDGRLSPERAVELMRQIGAALSHAHGGGVLHLDVMPGNVFLRHEGEAAVMDFRSGRAQKGRMIAAFPGSEGFRAPELLAGAGADERADVYGLGATLYFMLTGQRPVGSFARISELNPAARRFDRLVNRCLRAIPEERPESIEAFLKELEGSGESVALPQREDDLAGWLEVLAYQPDHDQALETLGKLEAGFREAKDWESLVALLLGRSEVEPESAQRRQTLRDVAGIFEREVGDQGKAFAALQAAFREDASNLEVQQDFERLAAATGLWSELVQEYSAVAQHQQEPRAACEWWVRVGRIYADKLQHEDYAVAAFNHVLSLEASHAEALAELAMVRKAQGDFKEQAKLLARQAKAEDDPAQRADLLEQLAGIYARQLGSDEEAILAYRQALEIAPSHVSTIGALLDLYRKAEMWEELAELMRGRIPLAEVSEDQARYRHVLADVLAEKLDAPDEAIDVLRALVDANPDDAKALRALERLYDATKRNDEYLEILNKRIAAAKDDHERIGLYRRLAAEWEGQAGGLRRAAEYLRKIHEMAGATEETYRALVRIYWELKDYPALVETYGWHIEIAERPEDRAVLFAALGRVYEEHLDRLDDARGAFESMLDLDAESAIALTSLARVHERLERWDDAAEVLDKLAKVGKTGDERVDALRRAGVIKFRHLQDLEGAEAALARAFEIRGDDLQTVAALADLHGSREDFGKSARMLLEAARLTQNELEKAERLFEAAELYRDKIRDSEKALQIFEQLLEIDPEHMAGAERAVGLYLAEEDFSKALPLLEMLLRKSDPADRKLRLERNLQLAKVAQLSDDPKRAEEALRAALELDATSKETLNSLAEVLFAREEYDEAGKLWQSLLVHRRADLPDAEVVEVFFKLGEVRLAQGDAAKAQNMVEKALEVDPKNPKVLERAIGIYEKKKDYESVVRCKRHLLEGFAEGSDPWIDLYEQIGDLLVQELKKPREALKVYEQILEVRPVLRRILYKEMEAHVALKSWEGALEAIKEMVSLEDEAAHRYRLHNTAAMILRDELKRPEQAAEEFNKALQADPTNMFAFELLKELYTEQKKYDKLVRAYRLMLKRLPENTPRDKRIVLWREMAELAYEELKDGREAIIALESLHKLGGQKKGDEEKLARLYASAGEDAYDKAVTVNQRILDRKPLHRDAYSALFTIYRERGEMDKAYCVALALSLLKSANESQRKLVEELRPPGDMRRATSRMSDDELWRAHIYHPTQDHAISEMLGITLPLFMPMALKERGTMQLKADKQLQPQDDTRAYARAFRYACEMLEVSANELYLRPGKQPLSMAAIAEEGGDPSRVLFVDPSLVKDGYDERELVFHFTRALSLMRAEHAVLYVSPTPTVIQALALASVRVTNPEYPVQGDVEVIDRLASTFHSDLPASSLDALAKRYDDLVDAAKPGGPERWMRAVELSLDRAGLLLCDDLTTAARLASSTEPLAIEEGLTTKERVAQIFRYAASERYFAARERLGLALKVK